MAFEAGYKSLKWSDQEARPQHDWRVQGISLGMAAGIGAGAFYYGIIPRADGTRAIDSLAKYTRAAGNLSPFQILNTFRAPEWLSPFTSPDYQRLSSVGNGLHQMEIGAEFLKGSDTYTYLKQLTGMSAQQLREAGLSPNMVGPEGTVASKLLFEKKTGDINGQLYSVVNGERKLLHAQTALLQFSGETVSSGDLWNKNEPVNKVAKSVFSEMDMWGQGNWSEGGERRVFTHRAKQDELLRPKFIPIPGMGASYEGTTYLRSTATFSMERFNQLLTNTSNDILGSRFTTAAKKLGFSLPVTPGPAHAMYARFGMKMGGLVGAGLLISESDWIRRQGGIAGQTAVSAGVSFGIGSLVTKAGFGGKAGMMAGIASFAGQMILPGFDQGVLPGIATTYAMGTEARALAINPFSYYRRTVEGLLPGVSGMGVGLGVGLGLAAASYIKMPGSGRSLPSWMLGEFGHSRFGMASKVGSQMQVLPPKSVRDRFWDMTLDWASQNVKDPDLVTLIGERSKLGGYTTTGMRARISKSLAMNGRSPRDITGQLNTLWAQAEEIHTNFEKVNPINEALRERLTDIDTRYRGKNDFLSRGLRQLEGVAEQTRHAFFGANLGDEAMAGFMKQRGFAHGLGRIGVLFGAGFIGQQLLTGGLLGSMETRQELKDIYSGRQLVNIDETRWWEGGGLPWEGKGVGKFRPHWYPMMMNRTRQQGIYGADEDRRSPLTKAFLNNFTYQIERETYFDRPYPISAAFGENIPIIGPAIAATFGQLIKPAKIMHANEWIRPSESGGLEYGSVYEGWKREPAFNLGAAQDGVPVSPFSATSVYGDMNAQFRDLGGLMGWATGTVSNILTGQDTYFNDDPRLAGAGLMTSHRRQFWDMALGGGGPFGEALRRVVPPLSNDYERINPLINNMPSWIPAQFRWGDPYAQMPGGEAILPGAGYESLHPELRGVDPENYPLLYRYDILSQISPKSASLRDVREQVYRARQQGAFSSEAEAWVDRIDQVVGQQWNVLDFDRVQNNAIELPGISKLTQTAWFGARQRAMDYAAPIENLLPVRPVQKFFGGDRTPIEQYEYERMYGSGGLAFWDKPFRDWLRPSMYSLANLMGYDQKPAWRVEADATNRLFDEMEFNKWMTLADQAAANGEIRKKIQYEYQAANTRMGVNPQGNPLSIYWTLPAEDRAYFNAFAFAEGKDRDRILSMIPSDQAHLYQAVWSRVDQGDPNLWAGNDTGPNEDYLYRQLYGMDPSSIPPADWVGRSEDVSLGDIKVRYVEELGRDLRDFGLWEKGLRDAYGQDFLEGSTDVIHREMGLSRGGISRQLRELMGGSNAFNVFSSNATKGTAHFEYNDDRQREIDAAVERKLTNGY